MFRASLPALSLVGSLAFAPWLLGADGCDRTVDSSCGANVAVCPDGQRCVARDGGEPRCEPAGGVCGGLAGTTCTRGTFCDFTRDALCGAADASGTCTAIPAICTREYAPVCGCDGNTYATECQAHAAGVAVRADGACNPCALIDCAQTPPGCTSVSDGTCCGQVVCP